MNVNKEDTMNANKEDIMNVNKEDTMNTNKEAAMNANKENALRGSNSSTMEVTDKLPEDFDQDADNAWTLPKVFYTSKTVFEKEKDIMLGLLSLMVHWH